MLCLREWLNKYNTNEFVPSLESMLNAGWNNTYDNNVQKLYNVFKRLAPKVKFISSLNIIDLDKTFVSFNYIRPNFGKPYNDIRIASIEDQEIILICIPRGTFIIDNLITTRSMLLGRGPVDYKTICMKDNWSSLKEWMSKNVEILKKYTKM